MAIMTTIESLPASQFSSLPAELRSQIWHEVLAENLPFAFFFYKKGCWHPRHILESDEDYDAENFYGILMKYRYELLDRVEVKVPLFLVNREARSIVRGWMTQKGIELHFRHGTLLPIFVRYFNPSRDALYVPVDKIHDFCCEPFERLSGTDLVGQTLTYGGCKIPNLAVAKESSWSFKIDFEEMIVDWICPSTLFVVLNAHADPEPDDDVAKRQQWTFGSTQERALVWDFDHRRLSWNGGESICDEDMYERIEEVANKDLVEKLVSDEIRDFQIRPTLAVRR